MHRDQAGDGVENGGLAAAIGAEQRHHAALRHAKRNIGHPDQVAVVHFEMLDREQGPDLEQRIAHIAGPPISSIGV